MAFSISVNGISIQKKKQQIFWELFYTCCKNVISIFYPKIDQDIRLENDINISEAPYMFFLFFLSILSFLFPFIFLSFDFIYLSAFQFFLHIHHSKRYFQSWLLSEFLPFIFCFINLISLSPLHYFCLVLSIILFHQLFAMNSFIFFLVFFLTFFFNFFSQLDFFNFLSLLLASTCFSILYSFNRCSDTYRSLSF